MPASQPSPAHCTVLGGATHHEAEAACDIEVSRAFPGARESGGTTLTRGRRPPPFPCHAVDTRDRGVGRTSHVTGQTATLRGPSASSEEGFKIPRCRQHCHWESVGRPEDKGPHYRKQRFARSLEDEREPSQRGATGGTQAVRWEENGVFRNQVKARTFAPHRGAEQSDFLKADTEALRIFQMTKDKEKTLRAAGEHGSWVTGRRAGQGVAGRGRPRPQPPPSPEDTRHRDFCSETTRNDPKRPVDCTGGAKTLPDAERVRSVLRALSLKRASSARKW